MTKIYFIKSCEIAKETQAYSFIFVQRKISHIEPGLSIKRTAGQPSLHEQTTTLKGKGLWSSGSPLVLGVPKTTDAIVYSKTSFYFYFPPQ